MEPTDQYIKRLVRELAEMTSYRDALAASERKATDELASARSQYQAEVNARLEAERAASRLANEGHKLHVDLVTCMDARDEAQAEAMRLTDALAAAEQAVERERKALKDAVECWRECQKAGQDWRAAAESQHEDNDGLRREVLRLHQIIGQLYAQSL